METEFEFVDETGDHEDEDDSTSWPQSVQERLLFDEMDCATVHIAQARGL